MESTISESFPGVIEAVGGFQSGRLDPVEHLDMRVRLADALEPWLHAFAYRPVTPEPPTASGPLGGIPVGVKDIIATADMPTGYGSPIYRDHRPEQDAWVVQRLRELGGLVFGKTVTTEFAWRHPGPTVNPFKRGHTPGGSSSGSAAAVAAGIVPLAFGTQTVGSIIRPAAFCGVVGLKPSFGTIPLDGVHAFSPSLDHLGLFARSVGDVACALDHFATNPRLLAPERRSAGPPRLLLVRTSKWEIASAEQQALLLQSARRFAAEGAVVQEAALPQGFEQVWHQLRIILAAEAAFGFGVLVDRYPESTSEPLQRIVVEGRAIPPTAYEEAQATQEELRSIFAAMLAGYDALLMLPTPGEAPAGLADTGDATFCAPWSFTGLPAITLPAGLSRNGLPLGLQFVAPWRQEAMLLRTAGWAERVLQWRSPALDSP